MDLALKGKSVDERNDFYVYLCLFDFFYCGEVVLDLVLLRGLLVVVRNVEG